jgi:hypothetical protein
MHDWYIFGAWLMQYLMVQVEVQVGAWLMHFFMVQFDYRLFGTGCYRFFVAGLLVQIYNGIYHSDSVIVVPSFYLYFKAVGWGKDRWL